MGQVVGALMLVGGLINENTRLIRKLSVEVLFCCEHKPAVRPHPVNLSMIFLTLEIA